jgi:putative polyhydroxyalkanoate system protein
MSNLSVTLPHQLSRADAKQRVEELISRLPQEYGGLVGHVEKAWNGDTMTFTLSASGVTVAGTVYVEDQVVRVEIPLSWPLTMFADTMKETLEHEGQKLLTKQ